MESVELHITVDGQGLTDLVRQMYCYENNEWKAFKILKHLDGITMDQATKVCEGYARFENGEDGKLDYIEEKDREFLKAYKKHRDWVKNVKLPKEKKEAQEIRKIVEDVSYGNFDTIQSIKAVEDQIRQRRIMDDDTDDYSDEDYTQNITDVMNYPLIKIPEPSAETIRVGRWDVPKNLLDRYADYVVKRIRFNFQNPLLLMHRPGAVDELANLELEREQLHEAICNAVGLGHLDSFSKPRTKDEQEFDDAIAEYLDEHAGSLVKLQKFIDKEESQGA